MRKWARKVAHYQMEKAGFTQINKGNPSKFAKHWHEYV